MFQKKLKKSQSSMEFIILIGIFIFFFTIFSIAIGENMGERVKEKRNMDIEKIAIGVQNEINLASKSTEGYLREFKIPDDVDGEEYDINITEGMVYVKTSDNKQAIALPVLPITGHIVKGTNLIKRQGGAVYLNP